MAEPLRGEGLVAMCKHLFIIIMTIIMTKVMTIMIKIIMIDSRCMELGHKSSECKVKRK